MRSRLAHRSSAYRYVYRAAPIDTRNPRGFTPITFRNCREKQLLSSNPQRNPTSLTPNLLSRRSSVALRIRNAMRWSIGDASIARRKARWNVRTDTLHSYHLGSILVV